MGAPRVDQKTSQVQLPAWFEDASQWNIDQGRELAGREYTAYEGPRQAEFNPLQNEGFNTANFFGSMAPGALEGGYNLLNDTSGQSMMGNAYGLMQSLAGQGAGPAAQASAEYGDRGAIRDINGGSFLGMDRDAYTNQYTQDVSNDVLSDVTRQNEQQQNRIGADASAAGAFGGSRHGVQGAIADSEANRNYGQISNQLNRQAFDAASGLMGQDLSRGFAADQSNQGMDAAMQQLNASLGTQNNQFNAGQANNMSQFNVGSRAGLLANMGNLGGQMGQQNINQGQALQGFGEAGAGAQLGAGDRIQQQDQANLTDMYNQFLEARDWTASNFQYANAGMPNQVGQTTSQDVFSPNTLQQGIATGTALGGAAMGGKSHSSFKDLHGHTDVDMIAVKVLSMPVWDWDYLDEHKPIPGEHARLGPLAEDFNKEFADPDDKTINFQRHISVLHATIQSLNKRLEELENK